MWSRLALLVASSCLYAKLACAGATCNKDQISACRTAALSGQLSDYAGSGQCVVKQYVQYTHLCTVSDYLPSVDHCCCPVADNRLLCCRYHQDWYHFRCTEEDDAIQLRLSMTSWQVLVPIVILSALVVVLLLIVCHCWRLRFGARRRSVRPETGGAVSVISESCLLRCYKWNDGLDDEKVSVPVGTSLSSSSSSAACDSRTVTRNSRSSASGIPIHGALVPSAPPPASTALTSPESHAVVSTFDGLESDFRPYACGHRCQVCADCSPLIIEDASLRAVSAFDDVVCGGRSPTECDLDDFPHAPPSYEISQRLHGRHAPDETELTDIETSDTTR